MKLDFDTKDGSNKRSTRLRILTGEQLLRLPNRKSTVRIDRVGRRKYLIITYPHGDYDIDIARIKTTKDVCHWVCHLSQKTWFTRWMAYDFIYVWSKHKGISIYD